jgi:uncharacterized protein
VPVRSDPAAAAAAATWVEPLTEAACMRLLGTVRVGRVALTQHALPVVVPVTFGLDGSGIVIPAAPGSVLGASQPDLVVAFQADQLDLDTVSGWSVLVTGTLREVTGRGALLRAHQLGLPPWPSGDRHHFVRITPGIVSGRRVGPAHAWERPPPPPSTRTE